MGDSPFPADVHKLLRSQLGKGGHCPETIYEIPTGAVRFKISAGNRHFPTQFAAGISDRLKQGNFPGDTGDQDIHFSIPQSVADVFTINSIPHLYLSP